MQRCRIWCRPALSESGLLIFVCTIPGLGAITAAAILIERPETGILRKRQIASFAGLVPMTRQSGRWRREAFIQGGRKLLRDTLYMPALVAARFNPDLAGKYNTMTAAGKPAKAAMATLMRKHIELANARVRQDRKRTPNSA